MGASRRANQPAAAQSTGDLSRLIEAERRLEGRLARSRQEAERLVSEARAAARGAEEALELELEAAAARLGAELEAEREREAQRIAERAQRDAGAFERVDAARVAELARYVVARVIGAEAGGGPGAA